LKENAIYKLNVENLGLSCIEAFETDFNFTPLDTIIQLTEAFESRYVHVLFLDFDKTLQIHNAAIPFHNIKVVDIFGEKKIRINNLAPLP
jgi:hypothetical protein